MFRPLSGTFLLFVDGNLFKTITLLDGKVGGVPLVGNWDGLPGDEFGLFRPATGTFVLDIDGDGVSSDADDRVGRHARRQGLRQAAGRRLGRDRRRGGRPVPPWDGVFTLDRDLDLVSQDADDTVITRLAGKVGGQALVGDWDGDGDDDVGLFFSLSGQWLLDTNANPLAAERTITRLDGAVGGRAVVGDFNGDGVTDCGLFRPFTGKWTIDLNHDGVYNAGVRPAVSEGGRRRRRRAAGRQMGTAVSERLHRGAGSTHVSRTFRGQAWGTAEWATSLRMDLFGFA